MFGSVGVIEGMFFFYISKPISIAAKTVLTSRLTHLIHTMSLLFSSAGIGLDILLSARSDPQQQSTTRHSLGMLLFVDTCFNTVGRSAVSFARLICRNEKPRNAPFSVAVDWQRLRLQFFQWLICPS
jgi:hypothetical protein